MPSVSIAVTPAATQLEQYCTAEIDSIKVYYPRELKVKEGFSKIRIKLKIVLFLKWLELEGAKAIASYD